VTRRSSRHGATDVPAMVNGSGRGLRAVSRGSRVAGRGWMVVVIRLCVCVFWRVRVCCCCVCVCARV
jgi:hypothetical protein